MTPCISKNERLYPNVTKKEKMALTSQATGAADLEELVLEPEVPDDLPDAWPHRDARTDLGELVRGLVDVDLHGVLRVLLHQEREDEATEARAAVQTKDSCQYGVPCTYASWREQTTYMIATRSLAGLLTATGMLLC